MGDFCVSSYLALLIYSLMPCFVAVQTTHKGVFVDHTLEAYKRNFNAALALDTRGLSKHDFAMSLRA
jgi:hypothetical protein